MFAAVRRFLLRHPILKEVMIWTVPAIVVGIFLRLLLLSYIPYAYWGSDSRSYFSFAHKLLETGDISLDEKRRYLYPILVAIVGLLPGATLKWLAWLQHGFGVLTLLPLAYAVRKSFVHWKLWIIPITVAFAGLPLNLWYEHELLGENVFFALLVWTFAGWIAWVKEVRLERAQRLFWCFFVPLTLFIITKPSGRFVWPGIACGFIIAWMWRRLTRWQWAALAALILVTLTVGSKKQGAWLLYVATFPLTNLESPLHAEYKAEIRDMVEPLWANRDVYYKLDDEPFAFLESPEKQDARPLWKALGDDAKLKSSIYMHLALEGIKTHPVQFLRFGMDRTLASINIEQFKEGRFEEEFYPARFERAYEEARTGKTKRTPMHLLFGTEKGAPLPPYSEFAKRLSPRPDTWPTRVIQGWVAGFQKVSRIVHLPQAPDVNDRQMWKVRMTVLGWVLAIGAVLSFLPYYRATLGVWTLVAVSYMMGVFVVSQPNARYLGPVWPVLFLLVFVGLDVLVRIILSARNRT